jgi:hypothetical protein
MLGTQLKSPGHPGLLRSTMHLISVFRDKWGCIELVVDTGAEDVVMEADIGLIGSPGEIGLRSEIHVEVFQFSGPVEREFEFDASAGSPAHAGVAARHHWPGKTNGGLFGVVPPRPDVKT